MFLEILIGKVKFIRSIVGSSIGRATKKDFQMLDELYGSGEFDENQTKVDTEKDLASSVEGLARLYAREEVTINRLREESKKIERTIKKWKECKTRKIYPENDDQDNPDFVFVRNVSFPDAENFVDGTPVGLYRIQMIFNVPFENMICGNISADSTLPHFLSVHQLNSEDCLKIANLAKHKNHLHKTVEWLKGAENLTKQEEGDLTIVKRLLDKAIKLSLNKVQDFQMSP